MRGYKGFEPGLICRGKQYAENTAFEEGKAEICSFETCDGKIHTIDEKWDLLIAHPPCTYLSNAGAARLYPQKGLIDAARLKNGLKAKRFFMNFYNADCDKICVENPIPSGIFELPKYTQIIQPFEHGHPFSKKNLSLAEKFTSYQAYRNC